MNSFFEIMKKAGWLVIQSIILVVLLCGHAWLIYTNFTALKVSFELAKYDLTPVGADLLTGWIWQSLGFYDLTQAHMIAACIAFFAGFLSVMAIHHIYGSVMLLLDKRVYAKNGDTSSLELANTEIIRHLVKLGLVLIPLLYIIHWDLLLYKFRTAAPVLGMTEDNAIAMKDWPLLMQQHSDLFAMSLTRNGAWGYIAVVAGAGLAVELWLTYVRVALERLIAVFQAWYEEPTGAERPEAPQPQQATQVGSSGTAQVIQAAEPQIITYKKSGQGAEPVEFPKKETIKPNFTSTVADDTEEATVYGGRPGEKVKFSVAAADSENYSIDESRRVWKRTSRADIKEGEPAAAAA